MVRKLFLIAIVLGLAHTAVAQDFRKVIDIVGEMEVTLKQMISREEQQRKGEIASLRQEVAELRTVMAQPSTAWPPLGLNRFHCGLRPLSRGSQGFPPGRNSRCSPGSCRHWSQSCARRLTTRG